MCKITEDVWREFEKLVYAIIKDTLNLDDNNSISEVTEKRNDGGYDGVFIIPVDRKKTVEYKILFEAKLRRDIQKDLPLQDFSKALIIAINTNADTLIIGTNLHLSENSKKQLSLYSYKTGLAIKLLDGKSIDNWLKKQIQNDDIIDSELHNLLKGALSGTEGTTLTDFSEISHYIKNKTFVSELLGEERRVKLNLAKHALFDQKRNIIISGDAGVGKSFFSRTLMAELENRATIIHIDIKICPTPRTLFLNLIEQTWNIPSEFLNLMECQNFKDAISYVGENTVDAIITNSVIDAFGKSTEAYSENAEIFNHYLIQYLADLYEVLSKRNVRIVNIINCNSATSELLDFLIQMIEILTPHISFVIELRTSPYIDGVIEKNTWEKYVLSFKNLVNPTCIFEIKELKKAETFEYIDALYNEGTIDDTVKDYIFKQSNSLPLFIEAFVTYLNITKILKKIPDVLQLETIKRIHIDNEIQLIQLAVKSVCMENSFYSGLLAVLSIFEGSITEELVKKIFPEYNKNELDEIVKAGLIITTVNEIKIKHILYLDYLNRMEFIGNAYLQELASKVLKEIEHISLSTDIEMIVRIKISEILNDNLQVALFAFDFSTNLYQKGQYYLSYQYSLMAYENVSNFLYDTNSIFLKVKILENLIQTSFYLKEKCYEGLQTYTNELESLINLYQFDFVDIEGYYFIRLQAYMILSRYVHTIGEFEKELNYMKQAEKFISENRAKCEESVITNIWVEYAIALKEKEGLNGYIHFLEQKIAEYPLANDLNYTLNSAMYQKLSITAPDKAMAYLENNIKLEPYMAIPEKYHNRVHLANNMLYSKDYDKAVSYSLKLLQETERAGLKNESGRIGNILGCAYLIQNEEAKAKQYFEYSINIYQNNNYVSYLWPILVNYVTLNFEYKNHEKALTTIKTCIEIFQKYKKRTNNLNMHEVEFEKSYVAYLLLIRYLKKYQKEEKYQKEATELLCDLLDGITRPQLIDFASGTGRLPDKLKRTSYSHKKLILLGY